jgi:ATP-dependent DNA helicase RecQ
LITDAGKAVLKGDERVMGVLDRTKTTADGEARPRTSSDVENKYNEHLFEELRKKRKELADEQDIPPYVIFPDTTLMELSYYYPMSEESMMGIYGVGSSKLKKYGDEFLPIIREFCGKNNLRNDRKVLGKK